MKRPFEKFISQNIFAAPAREWKPKLTRCSTSGGLFPRFPPTISDFVRKKSKGSSVCQARQRVLSSRRPRPRRLFVCPSNERAQVHLSFQFLSFHNATLWIYIVYSYLAHCIHSPARLLPDASIFEMDLKIESSWPQEAALRSTKAKVTLGMHSATFLH